MLAEGFYMGGYASYVWPACAMVIVLWVSFGVIASYRLRRLLKGKTVERYVDETQTADLSH